MQKFNRLPVLFFVFFLMTAPFDPVRGEEETAVSSLIEGGAVQEWKKDGGLFRFSAEKEALSEIWEKISVWSESAVNPETLDTADFTLFRRQSRSWKGKMVRVTGRLLRTVFVADSSLSGGGYYDSWFLFDDEKQIPARLLTESVPDGFLPDDPAVPAPNREPGKILYRQERIEAAAVYYRQTAFSDGDDLYTAPTLAAKTFRVLSAPGTDRNSAGEKNSAAAENARYTRSRLIHIFVFLTALGLWLLIRRRFLRKKALFREAPEPEIPEFDPQAFAQITESGPVSPNTAEPADKVEPADRTDAAGNAEKRFYRAVPLLFLLAAAGTVETLETAGENLTVPAAEKLAEKEGYPVMDRPFWESITGLNAESLLNDSGENLPDNTGENPVPNALTAMMDRLNRNLSEAILAANLPAEGEPLPAWPDSFGRPVRYRGIVEELEPVSLGTDWTVYRLKIRFSGERTGTIFVQSIPEAWREDFSLASGAETGGIGVLFRSGRKNDGADEVLLAKRTAFYGGTRSAGRLGIDQSIFDGIRPAAVSELETMFDPVERKNQLNLFRLTEKDTLPFYTLLSELGHFPAGTLTSEAKRREREGGTVQTADLFNHPEQWQQEAVTLTGHVKRARKVPVHDPAVRALYGLNAYYELYLFTNDSQGYPLVCCTAAVPDGFPLGVGEDYREDVSLAAVYYKPWGYKTAASEDSDISSDSNGAGKGTGTGKGTGWIAVPLMIGGDIQWAPAPAHHGTGMPVPARAVLTVCFLLFGLFWLYRRIRPRGGEIEFQVGGKGKSPVNRIGQVKKEPLPDELPSDFPVDK